MKRESVPNDINMMKWNQGLIGHPYRLPRLSRPSKDKKPETRFKSALFDSQVSRIAGSGPDKKCFKYVT